MGIGTIATLIGLLSSGYGMAQSGRANKQMEKKIAREKQDLQSWYDTESNTNFLDTDMSRSTLEILQRQLAESNKNVDSKGAMTGETAESSLAKKSKGSEMFGDTVTQLAGYGTRYRDALRSEYVNRLNRITGLDYGMTAQKGQSGVNLGMNSMNMLGMVGQGAGFDNGMGNWLNNLFQGSNKNWVNKNAGSILASGGSYT